MLSYHNRARVVRHADYQILWSKTLATAHRPLMLGRAEGYRAVQPPSTITAEPVVVPEAGAIRYSTAAATSSS